MKCTRYTQQNCKKNILKTYYILSDIIVTFFAIKHKHKKEILKLNNIHESAPLNKI